MNLLQPGRGQVSESGVRTGFSAACPRALPIPISTGEPGSSRFSRTYTGRGSARDAGKMIVEERSALTAHREAEEPADRGKTVDGYYECPRRINSRPGNRAPARPPESSTCAGVRHGSSPRSSPATGGRRRPSRHDAFAAVEASSGGSGAGGCPATPGPAAVAAGYVPGHVDDGSSGFRRVMHPGIIWFRWYRSCVLLSSVLAGAAFLEGGYARPGVPACGVRLASGGRLLRGTSGER